MSMQDAPVPTGGLPPQRPASTKPAGQSPPRSPDDGPLELDDALRSALTDLRSGHAPTNPHVPPPQRGRDAGAGDNEQWVERAVAAATSLLAARLDPAAAPAAREGWEVFQRGLLEGPGRTTALGRAVARAGLDRLEIQALTLALAHDIEPAVARLVTELAPDPLSQGVTVGLILEVLCTTATERYRTRQRFAAEGRLLASGLVSLSGDAGLGPDGDERSLLRSRVVVPPPAARALLDEAGLPPGLGRFARLETPTVELFHVIGDPSGMDRARRLVAHHDDFRRVFERWGFERVVPYGRALTLLFSGPSGTGKTLLAQALARHAQRPLLSVSAADLPERDGVERVLRDLFAEAALRGAVVLIDECQALFGKGDPRRATAFQAIESFEGILLLTTSAPDSLDEALERRIVFHLPMEAPGPEARRQIWEVHLPPDVALGDDVDLDALATRYDFTGGTIKNAVMMAVAEAVSRAPGSPGSPATPVVTGAMLEDGCRSQLRYALESLTERTTTHLRLDDIVLSERVDEVVREFLAAARNQTQVLNRWGFGQRLATGKGLTVLFDGPPGTGKTYCAEILAGELDRPLYRVNLPEVVSKWVGETEKHIKSLFQQARLSHAMLLFDEADSLFSARVSETRSSNDRYANMEVNLLLQEIERFPGVVILTTNHFGALDRALVRRIAFRATFEKPDAAQREQIWRCLIPPQAPLDPEVNLGAIARAYELTGGEIKNALLRAAYWAADRNDDANRAADPPGGDRPLITQADLARACRREYVASGKVVREPGAEPPAVIDHTLTRTDPPTPSRGADAGAKRRAAPNRRGPR